MDTLFSNPAAVPLAEALRPKALEEVLGQAHILGPDAPLGRMIVAGRLGSLIFWGPPGCGKTTIARLLADAVGYSFVSISAIFSGVADLKKVFEAARETKAMGGQTLLFVDEIHRFNRAQQDSFLPVMEDGTLILVGATTENPSFALNAALLSRAQVLTLRSLDEGALEALIARAEAAHGQPLRLAPEARQALIALADGDGRYLITMAEQLFDAIGEDPLDAGGLSAFVQQRPALFDKAQDGHFNLMSALHKSLRGSDPQAGLYYFARMMVAGEDPAYVARRLVRFASEDIGLADPQALPQALAGWQAFERLGSPEGELAIAQVVLYLATAPKSNAAYTAIKAAMKVARETGSPPPPKVILNAPTKLMKEEGYGDGYIYDHDTPEGFSGQDYFPEAVGRQTFYTPIVRGYEREVQKRLAYWQGLRERGET